MFRCRVDTLLQNQNSVCTFAERTRGTSLENTVTDTTLIYIPEVVVTETSNLATTTQMSVDRGARTTSALSEPRPKTSALGTRYLGAKRKSMRAWKSLRSSAAVVDT